MFDSVFAWIRNRTRAAVLAGFADALGSIDGAGDDGADAAVATLAARLKALPAPPAAPAEPAEDATRRRRKAEPVANGAN